MCISKLASIFHSLLLHRSLSGILTITRIFFLFLLDLLETAGTYIDDNELAPMKGETMTIGQNVTFGALHIFSSEAAPSSWLQMLCVLAHKFGVWFFLLPFQELLLCHPQNVSDANSVQKCIGNCRRPVSCQIRTGEKVMRDSLWWKGNSDVCSSNLRVIEAAGQQAPLLCCSCQLALRGNV